MTLIVAADVQDHLILAGDHCAVMSRVSNQGAPEIVLDNYRKVYPWKYGAICGSGDVFLMVYFCRLFLFQEGQGQPIDLLQVARQAKQMRSRSGIPPELSTGNIFFTLPGREGLDLYCVSVGADRIDYDIMRPISTQFSLQEGTLDELACQAFTSCLRPSFFFRSADEFHRHHLDLLSDLFARKSAADALVTSSFDLCVLERRTGAGTFWQVSEVEKQIATIDLQAEDGDAAPQPTPYAQSGWKVPSYP